MIQLSRIQEDTYYLMWEAAELLQVPESAIARAVRRRQIVYKRIGRKYHILGIHLKEYALLEKN